VSSEGTVCCPMIGTQEIKGEKNEGRGLWLLHGGEQWGI